MASSFMLNPSAPLFIVMYKGIISLTVGISLHHTLLSSFFVFIIIRVKIQRGKSASHTQTRKRPASISNNDRRPWFQAFAFHVWINRNQTETQLMFILSCSTRMWLYISPCDMHAHVSHVWGTCVGDERGCGKVSATSFVSHLHEESLFRSLLKTFFFFFGNGVFTCVEVGDLTGAGLGRESHCLCMTVL